MFENANLLSESFGALAVVLNFIGYRQQNVNQYRLISALALASLSTHFFLLGNAEAAGLACAMASIRNIIALRFRGKIILVIFVLLTILFFLYEWFYLNSTWIIIIAYTSSMIFTVGSIVLHSATKIRQWFIIAEALGLIYALIVGSIFGTVFNISNLCSIFLTLYKEKKLAKN